MLKKYMLNHISDNYLKTSVKVCGPFLVLWFYYKCISDYFIYENIEWKLKTKKKFLMKYRYTLRLTFCIKTFQCWNCSDFFFFV